MYELSRPGAMTDHEISEHLSNALLLVEAVHAEFRERRSADRDGFKLWGTSNLDAQALCRDMKHAQDTFGAALRRRRRMRRGFRERVSRTAARKALAS